MCYSCILLVVWTHKYCMSMPVLEDVTQFSIMFVFFSFGLVILISSLVPQYSSSELYPKKIMALIHNTLRIIHACIGCACKSVIHNSKGKTLQFINIMLLISMGLSKNENGLHSSISFCSKMKWQYCFSFFKGIKIVGGKSTVGGSDYGIFVKKILAGGKAEAEGL